MTARLRRESDSTPRRSQITVLWTITACLLLTLSPLQARAASAAAEARTPAASQQPPTAESSDASSPPSAGSVRTKLVGLTFVHSPVTPTDGSDAAGKAQANAGSDPKNPGEDDVDTLIKALNALYGTTSATAAQRVRGGVLLHGNPQQLSDMTRAIDQFDQPYPQVQLNMWAVQISGSPAKVGCELHRASQLIGKTRDNVLAVKHELVRLVTPQSHALCVAHEGKSDEEKLVDVAKKTARFFPFDEPMSINEALILLIASPDREARIDKLADFAIKRQLPALEGCEASASNHPGQPLTAAFARLKAALPTEAVPAHCDRLVEFLKSYDAARRDENKVDQPPRGAGAQEAALTAQRPPAAWKAYTDERNHALELRLSSSRLDSLLHAVTDAFVADVQELYFDPLLEQLMANQSGHGDGVSLVGRSRLVVTSSLESDLDAEMASYAETTRPKPFGKDLIDALLPSSGDSTGGVGALAKTAATAAVPQVDAGKVAAVVLSEPEPRYSKVAPGIAVHVRPTVLADGSAARLKIDARFGVAISDYNPSQQKADDQWVQAPPPGISAHRVLTDAAVSAFDLFDISSFSVDTVVPRSPYFVPILSRLPIIGHVFEIPRKNQSTRHESIVLVNTVILPRAMALASFYVGGED